MNASRISAARGAIRRRRRRRSRTAAHVWLASILAAVVFLLAAVLSFMFDVSIDLSGGGQFALSKRTTELIEDTKGRIVIAAFFERDHQLFTPVRRLLQAYKRVGDQTAGIDLAVHVTDIHSDVLAAGELAADLDVERKNVVVVGYAGRWRVIPDVDLVVSDWVQPRTRRAQAARFCGETVLTAALWEVTKGRRPVVYALRGHGEHEFDDYDGVSGYSSAARLLHQDSIDVRGLFLAEEAKVPDDAAAVLMLGPKGPVTPEEQRLLHEYMLRDGRLLLLLDPYVDSGLEGLLADWGIRVGRRLVDSVHSNRVVLRQYGDHAVTRQLDDLMTVLSSPRVVERVELDALREGQLQVWPLGWTGERTWAEQSPTEAIARFDEGDIKGPLSVAVAAERGGSGVDETVTPERIVVMGDSDFLTNSMLGRGLNGNRALFLGAMNWLLSREALLVGSGQERGVFEVGLGMDAWRRAAVVLIVVWPLVLLVVAVWVRIRRSRG